MKYLDRLEHETIFILREAFARVKPIAMLWSIGKESTALLWMIRKSFFGHIPFPIIQLETEMELPEVYEFRDQMIREWGFDFRAELRPSEHQIDCTLLSASRAAQDRRAESLD
jgi:sulfate adenylyltransferase subunit 2